MWIVMDKQMKASKELIETSENNLKNNGRNVSIDWSSIREENQARVVNLKCNLCGHETRRSVKYLKLGKFDCQGCLTKSLNETIENLNLTFISYDKETQTVDCVCNICGEHCKATNRTLYLKTRPRCDGCRVNRYSKFAREIGLEFLGFCDEDNNTCKVRCLKDGNTFLVRNNALVKGNVACEKCYTDSYEKSLGDKNCKFICIDRKRNEATRAYYESSDGYILSAKIGNVLNGKFKPTINGNWDQEHEVYCFDVTVNGDRYLKIGTANNSSKRYFDLKINGTLNGIFIIKRFDHRRCADKLEKEIHKMLQEYKLDRDIAESFTGLVRSRKIKTGQRVKVKDGCTEWFTAEAFNKLKTIIKHA